MITVDPDLAPLVRVARVGQIWRRSRLAVYFYVLACAALGLGTSLASDHPVLWASVMLAFFVSGTVRWWTLLAEPPPADPDVAATWLRRFGRQTALAALLWGLFACYVQLAYRGTFLQFAVVLISAGVGCFALGAFAGERKLTLIYLCCSMVPTLIGLASGGNGQAAALVCMLLLFYVVMLTQLFEINDWFVRSTVESLLLERSRKEAEAAARVKSEFLANMSHELRTPMNGVMGVLELLLQSGLTRDQRMLVQTSHRSAEALLEILNDILDFSKMSAGKLDFAHRDFPIRDAIEEVFELLGPRALERGLDLGYSFAPGVPDWVLGDEGRLRQVLMNLVSNSIKFSHGGDWPNGGSVLIEVHPESRTGQRVRIRFSVIDHGRGMSAATVAMLFSPFMQADTSTSRRFGGTGLGLAISRQLVEAMGGSIRAESEEGKGATFTFDIDFAAAGASHSAPPQTACAVLVLEEAPLSRATIGQLLKHHNASVRLTASREEAEPFLVANAFPCVIASSSQWGRLRSTLPTPAPAVFLLVNRGEVVEPAPEICGTLIRPVRSAQIAEALVAAGWLPRQTVPAPVARPARLVGHVLIAEDNAVNQMLAQRLVESIGLTSDVVPNGEAALLAVEKGGYALVLMDCQMPGMDGYEATRRLRKMPGAMDIPIVAMTANAMKGDRELCLAVGMNDYISKPIRLERLRDVLSRYLPGSLAAPESKGSK